MTDFIIYSNQISGTIPVELGNARNVIAFRAANNLLTGAFLSEVFDVYFAGTIPDFGSVWLNCQYLEISGNQLTGMCIRLLFVLSSFLGGNFIGYPNLSVLRGSGNLFTNLNVDIQNKTSLMYLIDFSHNMITNLPTYADYSYHGSRSYF